MTRANSINVTIAHSVLSTECATPDLVWLLEKTPANLVVINFGGDETR